MFKIEISDDRSPERRRPDPVVAQEGVFGVLNKDALSAPEQARPAQAIAAQTARARRPNRLWLPQDVMKYMTRLYARFKNPWR